MQKLYSRMTMLFVLVFSLLISNTSVFAQTNSIDLSAIDELAQLRVDNGTTPGVTVLVKKGDHILHHKSYGYSYLYDMGTLLENPIVATNETLYDLASVTKVLATTQAIMMLVDKGQLDIDLPVATYMPEFGINGKEIITARDLLTHTSGLAQWKPTYLYVDTRAGEKEFVNNLSIEGTYGSYAYSDFSFMTLAFLVEAITGSRIEDYLEANFYGPLGMVDTGFVPLLNGIDKSRIAATSWGNPYEWRMSNQRDYDVGYDTSEDQEAFDAFTGWREYTLIGEVNDGNAGMANEGVAGHAGLFSTAFDISKLGDMMLNGGSLNGVHYYSPEVLSMFTQADPARANRGLGWRIGPSTETGGYIGALASPQTFAHDGFTGTQVIFDPAYDLQIIILSNKQNYGPYNDNGSYYSTYALSREISTAVYQQVIDNINNLDTTQLDELIQTINETDLSLYTDESVSNLNNTLTQTNQLLEEPNLIQLEVDAQFSLLQEAFNALETKPTPVDKSALETLVASINDMNLDLYTPATVGAVKEAISHAQEVLNDPEATQDQVNLATTQLQNAIDALELIPVAEVDKTKLETLVTKAQEIDSELYTDDSIAHLQEVIKLSNEIIANTEATQAQVDDAVTKLQEAIDALELKPTEVNKTKLQDLIDLVKKVDKKSYTGESVNKLNTALRQAEEELANKDATQQEVDAAYNNLKTAYDALVKVPSTPTPDDKLPDTGQGSNALYIIGGISLIAVGLWFVFRKKKDLA